MSSYTPTIGIECHVQLRTKTKLFASVGNDAREAPPNTLVSHICLGMPGALPVLNREAIVLAIRAAFALNTRPQKTSMFDRKHYFYPDLPKGYQISQLYKPIILGGHVDINIDGEERRIDITRAHLEEDAGKSTHPAGKDYSLVDLNRAGTPLLEIVSEPQIHTPQEAKAYARELYLAMKHSGVSDADLYYGNMRFDVNVSVSNDPSKLGERTETKNLNSFRSVEKAVEYEIKRQIDLLEKGQRIIQETRGWDEAKQKTFSQRSKEDAHDYRYMPDPDIPPVVLDDDFIEAALKDIPLMPKDLRSMLRAAELDVSSIETILDNLPASDVVRILHERGHNEHIKRIGQWLAGEVQAHVGSEAASWESLQLNPDQLVMLSKMVEENKVSSTGAKTILIENVTKGGDPQAIAEQKDLLQVSDEGALEQIVDNVLQANPKAADDVRAGEMKAIGFLVGQVMKESKGKANPGLVQKLIRDKLS